jgi:hypothetical protein
MEFLDHLFPGISPEMRLVVAAIVLGLYFCPTIVAYQRSHRNALPIAVLNLLAGWTFLGWVAALVWALTRESRSDDAIVWEMRRQNKFGDGLAKQEVVIDVSKKHYTNLLIIGNILVVVGIIIIIFNYSSIWAWIIGIALPSCPVLLAGRRRFSCQLCAYELNTGWNGMIGGDCVCPRCGTAHHVVFKVEW